MAFEVKGKFAEKQLQQIAINFYSFAFSEMNFNLWPNRERTQNSNLKLIKILDHIKTPQRRRSQLEMPNTKNVCALRLTRRNAFNLV